VIRPGIVKVAIPGATVALLATGSAVAYPDQTLKTDVPIASSPLQLARDTQASRDALRPSINLSPTPAKPSAPVAKHLKKQAPIPAKTRAAETAPPKIAGSKFTTTDVNVWSAPVQAGTPLTVLAKGSQVSVTGQVQGIWAQIVRNGVARWVKAQYLSATKPVAQATPTAQPTGGISAKACASGSAVETGLTPDAIRVHRAICNLFTDITAYGGLRSGDSGSEHATGHALDIMVSGSEGQRVADWLHAHYKELGVSQLIWQQHIWTVQRSSEGWRAMPDRGSITANHYDHVHVTVYGNAGTV
jgi:hypothetical protein